MAFHPSHYPLWSCFLRALCSLPVLLVALCRRSHCSFPTVVQVPLSRRWTSHVSHSDPLCWSFHMPLFFVVIATNTCWSPSHPTFSGRSSLSTSMVGLAYSAPSLLSTIALVDRHHCRILHFDSASHPHWSLTPLAMTHSLVCRSHSPLGLVALDPTFQWSLYPLTLSGRPLVSLFVVDRSGSPSSTHSMDTLAHRSPWSSSRSIHVLLASLADLHLYKAPCFHWFQCYGLFAIFASHGCRTGWAYYVRCFEIVGCFFGLWIVCAGKTVWTHSNLRRVLW